MPKNRVTLCLIRMRRTNHTVIRTVKEKFVNSASDAALAMTLHLRITFQEVTRASFSSPAEQ
jgi:hypothetical protein